MSASALRSSRLAAAALLVSLMLVAVAASPSSASKDHVANEYCGQVTTPRVYRHVIVVLMENHSYASVIGSPSSSYVNSLVNSCGLATNYHNVTHYSLPNYLALTSGLPLSQLGPYVGDCSPTGCSRPVSVNSIFSESMGHGGWRGFDESMPVTCDRYGSGEYAPRHNPAVYYTSIHAACTLYDQPLGTLTSSVMLRDFKSETTAPAYSFVTPNLCDDTHDCSVATGDAWLRKWVGALATTAVYRSHDTVIMITWDEGEPSTGGENCVNNDADQSCHVAAIVVAPSVRPGTRSAISYSHYSLLATSEDLLHLPLLGSAKSATSLLSAFHL